MEMHNGRRDIAAVSTYEETVDYIMELPKFTVKNSMESTERFLTYLGNRFTDKKIIHVAGTNGKGSVCAYLCSVLKAAGISAGMFVSPHLVTMRERFVIDGEMVTEEAFLWAFQKVAQGLLAFRKEQEEPAFHPTFFEYLFYMAMYLFAESGVEYVVLETGLGGRLDATNSVQNKKICVITSIGYDHTQYLGDTLFQIAEEKAGIVRKNVPVVYRKGGEMPEDAVFSIEESARFQGAKCVPVEDAAIKEIKIRHKTIDFSFHFNYYGYISFTVSTSAYYQVENVALALRALEYLADERITVPAMQEGIRRAVWEGRMEEIMPSVYLDGAHNIDGIRAFLKTVEMHGGKGRRKLLFSVVKDKQYPAMIEAVAVSGLFDEIGFVELQDARALPLSEMEDLFGQYTGLKWKAYEALEEAFLELTANIGDEDRAYIVGSLYLAGEIKALIRRPRHD